MITIREIDHVVLRVRDMPAMLAFYSSVLGCAIEKRQEQFGLIQLRAGTALVDLVTVEGEIGRAGGPPPGTSGHNMDHVCFRVDPFDAEAIRAHLLRHGFDPGPAESRYGAEGRGPSIYVSDPDGNTVELKGPPVLSARASSP